MTALSAISPERIRRSNGTAHLLLELTKPARLGRVPPEIVSSQVAPNELTGTHRSSREISGETDKELATGDPDHRPEKASESSIPQTDSTGG